MSDGFQATDEVFSPPPWMIGRPGSLYFMPPTTLGRWESYLGLPHSYFLLMIFMAFGPAECTDVVAPVDAHVGVHVKNLVGEMYHEHMDSEERDKEFTDSERRVHLMQWSKAAWLYTKTHNQRLLREAFIKTGYFPLAADHSEDRMVKIKDMPDYLFRPPLR